MYLFSFTYHIVIRRIYVFYLFLTKKRYVAIWAWCTDVCSYLFVCWFFEFVWNKKGFSFHFTCFFILFPFLERSAVFKYFIQLKLFFLYEKLHRYYYIQRILYGIKINIWGLWNHMSHFRKCSKIQNLLQMLKWISKE